MMRWDYWRLITSISLSGFVGLLFDQMLLCMFLGLFAYTIWLQLKWAQLYQWLRNPKSEKSPRAEGVIEDICSEIERVRKQNKTRKKKLAGYLKRFQATTAALPDAVVVLGDDSLVQWSNKAAEELLGIYWPKDSHVRLKNVLRSPEFHKILAAPLDEEQQAIIDSPKHNELRLEIKIVRYMTTGRLLIARDITKTIKLQHMRRDFVANVSHELRTPLTVLRGYLETFTADSPAEFWSMALPTMQQQTERMHLMLNDLLELSRLETGQKELRHEPVDIASLLEDIREDAVKIEHFNAHDIDIKIESKKRLLADHGELRSAISNLVYNAVKYTPKQTQITLIWSVDQDAGYIDVVDQGEGIDEHHLERLTERFYRVDKGRSQQKGGTGLGLAIVKHVLQRHDAELTVSSEIGQGTHFRCVFPLSSIVS